MKIDLARLNNRATYNLLVGAVVPRPIAWVSTVDESGIFNLAPFAAYCLVSVKPAMVGISVGTTRGGQKKDTLRNIQSTKDFVVNVVDESSAESMNITSAQFPADIDEFKEAGLTPVKADLVKAPLLAESPVNMECQLNQILEFGEEPIINSFVIGEILRIHINDELYADGKIQMFKLKAIARLGGDFYCRTTDSFAMKRPD